MDLKYVPVLWSLLLLLVDVVLSEEDTSKGHWSAWSAWSDCSVSCGDGIMTMTSIWQQARGEKKFEKDYTMNKNVICSNGPCPVDGRWGGWSRWEECSQACGGGTRERKRTCSVPENGGKGCEGEDFQEDECNRVPCPPLPTHFNLSLCTKKHFMCSSRKMCIPMEELCDDVVQCHDGSDEMRCYEVSDSTKGRGRYSHVKGTGTSFWASATVIGGLAVMVIFTCVIG